MEKKTPLFEEHVRNHARLVPFAGFSMPVQYTSIIEEHQAVRKAVGLFDLSHMGEFIVSGDHAVEAVDRLMTNDIRGLAPGGVRYTPMCGPEGGILDDVLVYRMDDTVMLVVNASNIEKDFHWISDRVDAGVQVRDVSDNTALIAVQGPRAQAALAALTALPLADLAYYRFTLGQIAGVDCIVSRTGYTGEDGFELYMQPDGASQVWSDILAAGEYVGIRPVGLGARDTLRLEAGLALYGNDIDEVTTPLEAGLGWTVKFGDHDFIGREALQRQREEGLPRRMVAFEMLGRGIPRPHMILQVNGREVGDVRSGTFSPTFERGIGLAYMRPESAKVGGEFDVVVRQQSHRAQVVRRPIYKREGAS